MGDLIDLIMENFIIFALIIGAIFKFFTGDMKTAEEDKKTNRPKTVQHHKPQMEPIHPKTSPVFVGVDEKVEEIETPDEIMANINDQLQDQLQRYQERMNIKTSESVETIGEISGEITDSIDQQLRSKGDQTNLRYEQFQRQMKGQLTKDGLIEGIVMAEILGPPRALKPYRSVPMQRHGG